VWTTPRKGEAPPAESDRTPGRPDAWARAGDRADRGRARRELKEETKSCRRTIAGLSDAAVPRGRGPILLKLESLERRALLSANSALPDLVNSALVTSTHVADWGDTLEVQEQSGIRSGAVRRQI